MRRSAATDSHMPRQLPPWPAGTWSTSRRELRTMEGVAEGCSPRECLSAQHRVGRKIALLAQSCEPAPKDTRGFGHPCSSEVLRLSKGVSVEAAVRRKMRRRCRILSARRAQAQDRSMPGACCARSNDRRQTTAPAATGELPPRPWRNSAWHVSVLDLAGRGWAVPRMGSLAGARPATLSPMSQRPPSRCCGVRVDSMKRKAPHERVSGVALRRPRPAR